eukprot:TRINITY_DN8756_c0_g1_i2.p1 TRINITY_DN8756_c0_g1~~TRINITY_DN8756_c0_g1_i2.p1  ORF type:complete len:371 (-),score=-34.87 TRINITY_DN8756_c0_g1_i2:367-1479(-)
MTSGTRLPTWKERENNKRRERRRRAIAAKIYAGLRMYGNYKLPKHCDNNEVLKALCNEAGWQVEEDGTTYRKGCPPPDRMDANGGLTTVSPSPSSSYQPSPASSSFPSPAPSCHVSPAPSPGPDLIPWLKNLGGAGATPRGLTSLSVCVGGSNSAPVTPPLSSPTARGPRVKPDWDASLTAMECAPAGVDCPAVAFNNAMSGFSRYPFISAPASPVPHGSSSGSRPPVLDLSGAAMDNTKGRWMGGVRVPAMGPSSPTFSLLTPAAQLEHTAAFADRAASCSLFQQSQPGSPLWTPSAAQSAISSPSSAAGGSRPTPPAAADDFRFELRSVKPWEGERIHEECGGEIASDDLELTLGNGKRKAKTEPSVH